LGDKDFLFVPMLGMSENHLKADAGMHSADVLV